MVSFAIDVLESLEQRTVHTAGIASLLYPPRVPESDRAAPLMSYLSEDQDAGRFPMPQADPMEILIGPENVADALKTPAWWVASYDIGDGMRGVIGVGSPPGWTTPRSPRALRISASGLTRLFERASPSGDDGAKENRRKHLE